MAETFLFSIAEQILGKLASATFQQIGLAVGVNRDLKKLEETLSTIKAVLLDAEEKQATNRQLSLWLERLKDACYDADDVLDEFAYEALRRQVVTRGSSKTKVSSFFLHSNLKFRLVMGSKIKEIRERIDEIAADKVKFHLTEREVDHRHVVTREETHSFVRPLDVIGRDTDREKIVKLLTLRNIDKKFSVVPIVGLGGLGKTTLAKLVYNDERVKDCFQLKMWVCVSDDDFNLKKLTKAIIEAAIGDKCIDLSIDKLQTRLRDTLRDKKFLLVLDDVWNDNVEKWNELRELLLDGANGSKIVATTQSPSVASVMGTVPSYILEGLSDEDCWSLFVKCTFKEGQEKQHPNLERIGKEIVKKCHGVPLAVRSLGSMLFTKTDEREWISIKENEIWRLEQRENDIMSVLKLSYNHLPSYLKQCFAICSIFPKDYVFNNIELVEMWMAQGFIQPSNESEEYEDIGNKYINELMSRSFFQDIEEYDSLMHFTMHDLIHDIALLVAQSECYAVSDSSPTRSSISNTVRHVSFSDSLSTSEVPRFLLGLKNVRTIFFPKSYRNRGRFTSKLFVETCITRFKYIRMLDLRKSSFEELPSSVGSLKHLRHLDLSGNARIKKLPNSVCQLLHLQYLGLYGCSSLEELPRDIGNLISLRRLEVTTTKQMLLLQPDKGIGSLSSLRRLYIRGNLIELGEGMKRLTSLRTLEIWNCENMESLPRSVKHLSSLESLAINDCKKLNSMEMEWEDDDIHDDLRWLMRLRSLVIEDLPELKALPRWLQRVSNTLQAIGITDCPKLTALPEWLPNLTSLQQLKIWYCPELSALPEGMQRLTSLRELRICGCPELSRRCTRETGEDWHNISHVPQIVLDWWTGSLSFYDETESSDEETETGED